MCVYRNRKFDRKSKLGGLLSHLQTIKNKTRKTTCLLPKILILEEFFVLTKIKEKKKQTLKTPAYFDSW